VGKFTFQSHLIPTIHCFKTYSTEWEKKPKLVWVNKDRWNSQCG